KAALYLHNLLTILADKGNLAQPGKLDYSISNEPETVHDLLLQDSDGTFELVVWDERLKGTDTVKIDLGENFPLVKIYDPTVGIEPVQFYNDISELSLTLSDHPLVISIPNKSNQYKNAQ
ncbi:MAG TPA: glycosyl hydrolase, partial [Verrucomicrobiota bacterium]|nr:glycosyl hydrolase [Verrucomicrobiota bacterium]